MSRSTKRKASAPPSRVVWSTSPPCEAQKLLDSLISSRDIDAATKSRDVYDQHPLFRQYTFDAFRAHLKKTLALHGASLQRPSMFNGVTSIPSCDDDGFDDGMAAKDDMIQPCVFDNYPCTITSYRLYPTRDVFVRVMVAEPRNTNHIEIHVGDDKRSIEMSFTWSRDLWDVDAAYGDIKSAKETTFDLLPMIVATRSTVEGLMINDRQPPRTTLVIQLPSEIYSESLTLSKSFTQSAMILEAKVVNSSIPVKTAIWSL